MQTHEPLPDGVRLSTKRVDVLTHRKSLAEMLCDFWPATEHAWPSLEKALIEVDEALGADRDRIAIVALARDDRPIGWIAGFRTYAAAFELHPLVVHRDWQGRGIGRALVAAFEQSAASMGALTVYLGSDDTSARTNLGGRPLFPGVLAKAAALKDTELHPVGFYLRCGYEVVGVLPDVNGRDKPDIWLAKPIGRRADDSATATPDGFPADADQDARREQPGPLPHRA